MPILGWDCVAYKSYWLRARSDDILLTYSAIQNCSFVAEGNQGHVCMAAASAAVEPVLIAMMEVPSSPL